MTETRRHWQSIDETYDPNEQPRRSEERRKTIPCTPSKDEVGIQEALDAIEKLSSKQSLVQNGMTDCL